MDITSIPNISAFIPDNDPTSVSQRWKRWSDWFDNLMTAINITDNVRKKALLLHLSGEAVYDIFQGLVVADVPADADQDVDNVYTTTNRARRCAFQPKAKHRIRNLLVPESETDRQLNSGCVSRSSTRSNQALRVR